MLWLTVYCGRLYFYCLLIQVTSCTEVSYVWKFIAADRAYDLTSTVNNPRRLGYFQKRLFLQTELYFVTHRRCYSICATCSYQISSTFAHLSISGRFYLPRRRNNEPRNYCKTIQAIASMTRGWTLSRYNLHSWKSWERLTFFRAAIPSAVYNCTKCAGSAKMIIPFRNF